MTPPQGETDARTGVLRYLIGGTIHRAHQGSGAEAVLWSAMGLMHAADAQRRKYKAAGSPIPPNGIHSLADLADCWDARVRQMVRIAVLADGYVGSEET